MKLQEEFWVTDIHSHILPGLDDGAKNWKQSECMLDIAYREGIRKLITTPHFMPGHKNPSADMIFSAVKRLQEYSDQKEYGIRVCAGNEIFYHEEVLELLEKGRIMTLAGTRYVLVEFMPSEDFRYIRNSLSSLQSIGYIPILAHAERYENVLCGKYERIEELRAMGVLIQVNMASIEGRMGRKIQKALFSLLKMRHVDLLGTDAHSDGARAPYTSKCKEILLKRCPWEYVQNLLYKNAEKIIR